MENVATKIYGIKRTKRMKRNIVDIIHRECLMRAIYLRRILVDLRQILVVLMS